MKRDEKPTIAAALLLLIVLVFGWSVLVSVAAAQSNGSEALPPGDPTVESAMPQAVADAFLTLEKALVSDNLDFRIQALRAAMDLQEARLANFAMPRLEAPNLTERVLAYQVVANTSPELAKPALVKALRSGERTIRLRALLGLTALGDGDTVPEIVRILKEDPDPDLRAAAVRALGAIGDPKASLPLLEALSSQYSPVREQAVLALLKIREGDLVPVLTRQLEERGEPEKVHVMRLLALIPDPALVPIIRPYLDSGNNELRCEAAAAILTIVKESGTAQP
jgi:HEAT repeat protein